MMTVDRARAMSMCVMFALSTVLASTALAQMTANGWFVLVARGDAAAVSVAIADGAHRSVPTPHRYLDLLVVAQFTTDPEVAALIGDLAVDSGTSEGWFDVAVIVASAMNPSADVVRELVAAGGSPDARYGDGWTPLHYASAREDGRAMVDALLDLGADPNATTDGRDMPPVFSEVPAEFGSDVRALLRDVIDVFDGDTVRFREGVTPLMVAARFAEDVRTIDALLAAGAEPAARDEYDRLPIDHANVNPLFAGPARRESAYWTLNEARFE